MIPALGVAAVIASIWILVAKTSPARSPGRLGASSSCIWRNPSMGWVHALVIRLRDSLHAAIGDVAFGMERSRAPSR
jgi:hypothetical protein